MVDKVLQVLRKDGLSFRLCASQIDVLPEGVPFPSLS